MYSSPSRLWTGSNHTGSPPHGSPSPTFSSTRSSPTQMIPDTVDKLVTLKPRRFSRHTKEWRRTSRGSQDDIDLSLPSSIRVLSWNIDFMAEYPKTRMFRALEYIQHDVFDCKDGQKPAPCCILFKRFTTMLSQLYWNIPGYKSTLW
ncbi:hypothetical protein QCA50_005955 [Cerrena zonata]|uniref:Uncharacterized protein n=1 Tax=Cerrena zonata TaxID=2478898 RepID=A0AAW0GBN5_9APHY